MIYLTFGNQSLGIYENYVVDFCRHVESLTHEKVKIVTFISIRNFFTERRKIKKLRTDIAVLPSFPKLSLWKLNALILIFYALLFIGKKKTVIAKNPFAFNLCLTLKKIGLARRIVFDAEASAFAESKEFNIYDDTISHQEVFQLELKSIQQADQIRTVSSKLIDYWLSEFKCDVRHKSVIIPCTLSKHYHFDIMEESEQLKQRQKLGYNKEDIIIIYSGSNAKWQCIDDIDQFCLDQMKTNARIKCVFLSNVIKEQLVSYRHFPKKVDVQWVSFDQVKNYLMIADYGIILREAKDTNYVSAPTKFAEYLACGLHVIMSDQIGDYSTFARQNGCGIIFSKEDSIILEMIDYPTKIENNKLALKHFSNSHYNKQYIQIIKG